MKILDAFKSSRQKPVAKQPPEDRAPQPPLSQASKPDSMDSPAGLWYALCDDPNRDDLLPRLLEMCRKKGGPSAEYAALSELTQIEGSFLPQVYLGRSALEAGHVDEAKAYYQQVLSVQEPPDYAMFMISADMGRLGYASEMTDLILPCFSPESNNLYIGLNVLEACREKGRKNEGLALLEMIRPYENQEIRDYLDGFEAAFAEMPEPKASDAVKDPLHTDPTADEATSIDVENESTSDVPASGSVEFDPGREEGEREEDPADLSADPAIPAPTSRPVMLDLPVWAHGLIGLQDLLPNTVDRPRVGVYMYADTTPSVKKEELPEEAITPDTLAVSLPLAIAERLLFTTMFKPITLYPVMRERGPFGGNLEPDVQGLFSLCSKEALDYLVTGTIYQDHSILRIRTWILDRTKQSARVVAADIPAERCGEAFLSMLQEILQVFAERHGARSGGRSEFSYVTQPIDTVSRYLRATRGLILQYLVRQNECDAAVLTDQDRSLDVFAELVGAEPKNQVYFAMLLSAMLSDRKLGNKQYHLHRQMMYEVADKNRYTPSVKAVMKELNLVLQE